MILDNAKRASADHAKDVILADQRVLFVVELHLGATVFADEDAVADLDLEGLGLAVLVILAGAKGNDLGLLGLLLSGVRDDDATADLFLFLEVLHQDAIADGLDVYFSHMFWVLGWSCFWVTLVTAYARRESTASARN